MHDLITHTIFSAQATVASATSTSTTLTLNSPTGYFSLQITETGDGTGQWKAVYSNDGTTFVTPTGVSDIVTAHTKTSGTSGTDIYQLGNGLYKYMRITVTETGGASALSSTATLASQ